MRPDQGIMVGPPFCTPTLGIDRHRPHEEPRLRLLAQPGDRVECMFCGKEGQRPFVDALGIVHDEDRMMSCDEGLYPTMYFHRVCGSGRSGREIRFYYLSSVNEIFRGGDKPLMFD